MRSAQQGLAQQLEAGVLGHDDPETVRAGLPAYLVLIDGAIAKAPDDAELLCTGAKLYGAFGGSLLPAGDRAKRLAKRAWSYGARAACQGSALCAINTLEFDAIDALLNQRKSDELPMMRCVGEAWAGWIQANADDWNAIAEIPKVQRLFERVEQLQADAPGDGTAQLYLGVLNSLLPEAYGGKPERARAYFEAALQRSEGKNLMVHVLYAERYARLVFEQDLHDRLLREVLAAPAEAPNLTLINTLAKERAQALLESGKDYF